jgi:lysyl-tRNA synthetase class 2
MQPENRLIEERLKKLKKLREMGEEPYKYKYDPTHHAHDINEKYSHLDKEQKTDDEVKVAGRIMAMRKMGKITFMHIKDVTGRVQIYLRENDLGKEKYQFLKLLDIGDILGAEGIVFKTRTGEVTIEVKKFVLLTKSLRPLPEKFHGLKDDELRYRMRYVDLIMSPETMKTFQMRAQIIKHMRGFLESKGFIEVETPILQPIYGGGLAKPFTTHHNALDMQMYMRISNELYLKRLIVGGYEKVFEFSRDFRNEGIDTKHNPEFTIMETMCAYADYMDSMALTEEMLVYITQKVVGKTKVMFEGNLIDLTPPWTKMTMADAVKKFTGNDFSKIKDIEEAKKIAAELKVEIDDSMGIWGIMAAVFDELVEPKLIQPTFVMDHPIEISPLAKPKKEGGDFTERFEIFIGGKEYGNVYSELNDPEILRQNFEQHAKAKEAGAEETHPVDDDFVRAMEYGMPPTSGIGIGLDRFVMLLTGRTSIRDVIMFPALRAEEKKKTKKEEKKNDLPKD